MLKHRGDEVSIFKIQLLHPVSLLQKVLREVQILNLEMFMPDACDDGI